MNGRQMVEPGPSAPSARDAVLAGGGEMGALMRSVDWSRHPLGPVESWSQSLRMMVKMLLANRFPLNLWWGPEYFQLYNDAYRPILGAKHPSSMGQPGPETWREIWHVLAPLFDTPFHGGPATWVEDLMVEMNRHGYLEETHFTVAYSPVPDETAERGIGGVLATVHEITEKIIGERRLNVLSDLGGRSIDEAHTAEVACALAAGILAQHPLDVPFALVYLIDAEGRNPRLAGSAGVRGAGPLAITDAKLPSSALFRALVEATRSGQPQVIGGLASLFETLPQGPWQSPPHQAVAIPIPSSLKGQCAGVLVAGVSARLALDERYLSFLLLVAAQIATAISNARAFEEEKRRVEELAELDRAKTAFFSNVSHELRTPLSLMIGPLEEALERPNGMIGQTREELTVVHRNALRLLKLVNTLLEFSRIEAGRAEAAYEETDIAAYTAELASGFRSAIERAGLRLVLDLPKRPLSVFVDREMWEKVVLNLLSNAFKHTFQGEIEVSARRVRGNVRIEVRDTGVGIPADQLPHVFERFHRVPNAKSRAHEGTGIGLALVRELVALHHGRVEVLSEEGKGTTFAVTIPTGAGHLPSERIGAPRPWPSTALGAAPYVEEALRWLPGATAKGDPSEDRDPTSAGHRIVLADDNADMREYVTRLLRAEGWRVEPVSDGQAALDSVRRSVPALVLSDVMMPGLDGFHLLRELRSDPTTSGVPVILLTARAAEEAKVEGMARGADDYLVKPFSANELIARVGAHLRLGDKRREALSHERDARASAERAAEEAAEANRVKSDFLAVMSHELRTPLNAIGGYAQLMEMEIHGPLTDKQRKDLERINESQRHLLGMINKVLNYAKLDAGVEKYEIEDIPLADVLDTCEMMTTPLARAKGQEFQLTRCDPGLKVRADREKVQQVLLNLLSNAVKFTDPRGTVTLSCVEDAEQVRVRVTDTGRGIAQEEIEKVFQPFVRLDATRARVQEGTGLGLAISRQLACAMGGHLEVESALGKGSTFTLTLSRSGG